MSIIATPARRRIAMAAMLGLALIGSLIRLLSDPSSTLHDVGTLLMVMWLPAVGNLVAFVIGWLRRPPAPRLTAFPPDRPVTPQLLADVTVLPTAADLLGSLDPQAIGCSIVVGTHGFTARTVEPLASWLADGPSRQLALEFLRPELALARLPAGTPFHILHGPTAVASARVIGDIPPG